MLDIAHHAWLGVMTTRDTSFTFDPLKTYWLFKWTHDLAQTVSVFVVCPTNQTSVAQAFFRWDQAQDQAQDTPDSSKNASGPVGPQAPSDKPSPSEEV